MWICKGGSISFSLLISSCHTVPVRPLKKWGFRGQEFKLRAEAPLPLLSVFELVEIPLHSRF